MARAYIGVPFGLAVGLLVVAVVNESMQVVIGSVIVLAAGLLLLGRHLARSARTDVLGGTLQLQ